MAFYLFLEVYCVRYNKFNPHRGHFVDTRNKTGLLTFAILHDEIYHKKKSMFKVSVE